MGMWSRNGVTHDQSSSRESLPPSQHGHDPASTLPSCHSTVTSLTSQPCQIGQRVPNPVQEPKSGSQSQGPGPTFAPVMPTISHVGGYESHPESTEESVVCLTRNL